jgi:serine phosphatase RsbU (regulator of sigma subunit)
MSFDDGAGEEVLVQHPLYKITRRRREDFQILKITGRYSDAMLGDFRDKVFLYKKNYALDLSGLTGATAALAREFADTAESLRAGEKRLVLLSPPEAIRSLLGMRSGKSSVEMMLSEDTLFKAEKSATDEGTVIQQLERVRKEFQTNRHWQFIDREGYWICPFCAGVITDVRLTSPLAIPVSVIEKAYHHIWSRCSSFKPSSPQPKPLAELHEVLRRSNDQKMVVTKQKLDRMETELATLKSKSSEMEDSVKRASERQRRLLPTKAPDVPGTEIDLIYRPAAVVSGDFYDFVPLDEGKVAVLIGDVSGHGIEAGILMGMAKKVLAIRLQDYQDPVEALVRTNEDIDKDLGRVNFVTCFVTIYDPTKKTLTCVRAGHNPPLLYNPVREGRCIQIKPGGLGLGILGTSSFEPTIQTEVIPVLPGDELLLYTDGLVEARNKEGEQFGIDRTIQALAVTYGYTSALVLSTLAGTLDGFSGDLVSEDDITALCIRFK